MSDLIDIQSHLGVVIRADGTIPFDDDCSEIVRDRVIAFLVDSGVKFKKVDGSRSVQIVDNAS